MGRLNLKIQVQIQEDSGNKNAEDNCKGGGGENCKGSIEYDTLIDCTPPPPARTIIRPPHH